MVALAAAGGRAEAARPADHVVVVVLDGTRPDRAWDARTPNLHRLAASGVRYLRARTVYPSQTRVGFVSLPTGAWSGSHGIIGGEEARDEHWRTVPLGASELAEAQALCRRPTVFEEATAAGLTSLYAAQKGYELVGSRGATWTIDGSRTLDRVSWSARYQVEVEGSRALALHHQVALARELAEQAEALIRRERPNLVVLNLGAADYAGHAFGPRSDAYTQAIEAQDGLLGRLLRTVEDLGLAGRTAWIVTADHGFSQMDPDRVVAPLGPDQRPRLALLDEAGIENMVRNTGGSSMAVYLRDPGRLAEVVALLRAQPWCEAVYCESRECDATLSELHAWAPGRSPTLMVDLSRASTLDRPRPGNHGSLRPGDMDIPLVLAGAGVREGQVLGRADLVDVAPTVVRLLGLPGAVLRPDGRALDEALAGRP